MNTTKDITWHRVISLDDPLFDAVWPLYVEAFPEFERRPHGAYAQSLADPRFNAYVVCKADTQAIYALIWYWNICGMRYVEYMAIQSTERGSGLGSRILSILIKAEATPIVLEIEELVDEASERRWRFYKQLGFTLHEEIFIPPPYVRGHQAYHVHLLTSSPAFSPTARACFIKTLASDVILTV